MNDLDLTRIIKHTFISKAGPFIDTVFSTRIKLIRNLYNIPFAHRQKSENINEIKQIVEKFIDKSAFSGLTLLDINSLDNNNKRFLKESSIISQDTESIGNAYLVLSDDEYFVILVNDQDHFKIQIIKPGFELDEAFNIADEVDNELNKFAIYAYSDNYGYITCNPSNSGFEVSLILHLPVLSFTKRITEAQDIVKLSRFNIEGLKQDGLKTFGSMFILSNGFSKGVSEPELLDEVKKITNKIINLESEARENYFAEHRIQLEDKIYRSYGLLKYARRISYVESMDLLSDIRLGIILSVIKNHGNAES